MSTKNPKKQLANVKNADQFVTKPGTAYLFNGRKYDLSEIDDATATALANNPNVRFIQWADEGKRPVKQRDPLPGKKASAAAAKSSTDKG